MFHENEVVMLLISSGVAVFVFFNWQKFTRLIDWKLLFIAFLFFLAGCFFTVIEGSMLENFFNYLEHACYLGNAVCLIIWCYRITYTNRDKNE